MEDIHRKVLQKNRPFLMKEVVLDTLWSHLLAKEIFTDEMIEHIQVLSAYTVILVFHLGAVSEELI